MSAEAHDIAYPTSSELLLRYLQRERDNLVADPRRAQRVRRPHGR